MEGRGAGRGDAAALARPTGRGLDLGRSHDDAIEFPLDEYALGAAEALTGFEDLDVEKPRPFKARYDAEAVTATGEKGGVRQRLELIAMRRGSLATYAVLIARNAEEESGFYAREALRIVRTLRGRPIG